jgi:hypothetical protein
VEDTQSTIVQEPSVPTNYSDREKKLRDLFVEQYLVDYDEVAAAIRINYPKSVAREMGVLLFNEPYVRQQIKLAQENIKVEGSETAKQRILAGLWREANYRGTGSSQAARVAALAKLAAIEGMDAPSRSKFEMTGPDGQPLGPMSGVFVVPGIMDAETWEKMAAEQQAALVAQPPIGSAPKAA